MNAVSPRCQRNVILSVICIGLTVALADKSGASSFGSQLPPKNAVEAKALAESVRNADAESKPNLIAVLADVSSSSVHLQDVYLELLDDSDYGVQEAAIKVAGKLMLRDAAPKIRRLLSKRKRFNLRGPDDIYKFKSTSLVAELNYNLDAIRTLIALDDFGSIDEIISRDEFMSEMPGAYLARFGAKVLPKVIENASKGWAQRIGANSTISQMRDETALPALIGLINGPDDDFAVSATEALAEIGKITKSETTKKKIVAQLESGFVSENKLIRTYAYQGLLNSSPSEYGPRVLKAFSKENEGVQLRVLYSITRNLPAGIEPFLERFIQDDERRHPNDQSLRDKAADILARMKNRKMLSKGVESDQKNVGNSPSFK